MVRAEQEPASLVPTAVPVRQLGARAEPALNGPAADSRWPATLAPAAALVAIVLAAYAPALAAAFIWDDDVYVTANTTLRSFDGLRRIWLEPRTLPQYYPLVHTTFWAEHRLWGLAPAGFHLTNVLLHAVSAVLAWRLLVRLRVPGAWLGAAIFAVHPVQVESVAWVTERKNVLSLVLALSSMLMYLLFAPPGRDDVPGRDTRTAGRWRHYFLAFLLLVAALLAKTAVAPLPVVLLLVAWWKRGRLVRRDLAPLVPFFAVALAAGSLTVWLEQHNVGALGDDWSLAPLERILVAGRALCFYAQSLLWPHPLAFTYPRWNIDASAPWQYAFPAGVLALLAAAWAASGRMGRGPLAAILIFAAALTPALGFFNVYPFRFSFVADHFQYHASLALIACGAAGATLAGARLGRRMPFVQPPAGCALLLLLGMLSFRQALIYQDEEPLWRDTIAKNPGAWMAYANLAVYVDNRGRHDEAFRLYRQALELRGDDWANRSNMGHILLVLGRRDGFRPGQLDEAIDHLREALSLAPDRPQVRERLGQALVIANRFDEAIEQYEAALRLKPDFADVHNDLGVALSKAGRAQEAIASFEQARALRPERLDVLTNLMYAYAWAGRSDDCLAAGESAAAQARLQDQGAQAVQIAAWLTSYRTSSAGRGSNTRR
jgi:Flp pilus assembly protein TadD